MCLCAQWSVQQRAGLWVWRVAVGVGVLAPLSVTRQAANAEGALYSMIVSKTFISSF